VGPDEAILKFYGYDASKFNANANVALVIQSVWIGNFSFYGASTMGAVIVDHSPDGVKSKDVCNLYLVTNSSNDLLDGLPAYDSYLCYGNAGQSVQVISANMTAASLDQSCKNINVTMTPLVYNGNTLVQYVLGANDHVHGGANGQDIIYGGTGEDDLDSEGEDTVPGNVEDTVFGEEGNDFVHGTRGDFTYLDGGPGVDDLIDPGGTNDYLYGQGSSDCCIGDIGHQFSVMSGGPERNDQCDTSVGSSGCESINQNACDQVGWAQSYCDSYPQ
jgi:hypothetical protein